MATIKWMPKAVEDLNLIGHHLNKFSEEKAKWIVKYLFEASFCLEEMPRLGRIVPEFKLSHIRELVREEYRIVYLLHEDEVHILAVLHGKQDLVKKLSRRK